jgi:type III restriction enzyme
MESSDRLRTHGPRGGGKHLQPRQVRRREGFTSSTRRKLGKKSLLVRGYDRRRRWTARFPETRPDLRGHTIWDTIRNTIEDPAQSRSISLLDEAHRGMGNDNREKSTIVKRLINGDKGVPGIPVVWGISATVERFNKAMEGASERDAAPCRP